jgi:hypothetical protein
MKKRRNIMSTIDEIIGILNKEGEAVIPRPATDEDIAECNEELVKLELEPLPPDYIGFLKKNNGLAWGCIFFYGTYQVTEAGDPDGFCLMDLATMNDEFNKFYELDEEVLIGRSEEDYFTYNIETKKYEALELDTRAEWEEFDTFEELLSFTVGGRLGLNDGED